MYLGRVVEEGTAERGDRATRSTRTRRSLLSVAPTPHPRTDGCAARSCQGELPDASRIPSGCRFHPRCPRAFAPCTTDDPRELMGVPDDPGHARACWLDPGPAPTA